MAREVRSEAVLHLQLSTQLQSTYDQHLLVLLLVSDFASQAENGIDDRSSNPSQGNESGSVVDRHHWYCWHLSGFLGLQGRTGRRQMLYEAHQDFGTLNIHKRTGMEACQS
jgi:hypothetical protein